MAGAMRKMGIYLGLVEDDERRHEAGEYDDYDEYEAEQEAVPARRERPVRPWADSPVAHEPAYEPAPQPYRITTLHPRTRRQASG